MPFISLQSFLPVLSPQPLRICHSFRQPTNISPQCSLGTSNQTSSSHLPTTSIPTFSPTPITPITFRGRTIHVKRDDLLQFAGITGSKLRKFYSLLSKTTFENADFLISYGGAQSNAMLSLAHLCKYHNVPFLYVTRPVPSNLRNSPGNFNRALHAGMHHIQIQNSQFRTFFTDLPPNQIQPLIQSFLQTHAPSFSEKSSLFIPQGGAWPGAEQGIEILAQEIRVQIQQLRHNHALVNKLPIIFLPCGTGTTAFYLQKHLEHIAKVVAVPVSGDERYLVKQMRWLQSSVTHDPSSMKTSPFPDILRPRIRASFADVRPDKFRIWQEMSRSTHDEFQFDLIYAPKAWEEVMMALEEGILGNGGQDIMYYHTGGVEGNVSMLGQFFFLSFSSLPLK